MLYFVAAAGNYIANIKASYAAAAAAVYLVNSFIYKKQQQQ
jgi:hypothetical protein